MNPPGRSLQFRAEKPPESMVKLNVAVVHELSETIGKALRSGLHGRKSRREVLRLPPMEPF